MAAEWLKEYHFKKGQSGNPNGRPKGLRNIKTILRDLLECDSSETKGVTRLEAICAKMVVMAENGDLASIDRVFDRFEGKPEQKNTVTADVTTRGVELTEEDYKARKKALEEEI